MAAITRHTTVIILGDARTNYNLTNERVMKEIKQRSKQINW